MNSKPDPIEAQTVGTLDDPAAGEAVAQDLMNTSAVTTIVIIETLPDGQERVLEPYSNRALIIYLETDQAIQEAL